MKIWNKTHSISICLRVQVPYFPSQSFPRETGGLRKATQGPQALGSFVSRRLAQYQVWMTFSNIFWISETETFLPLCRIQIWKENHRIIWLNSAKQRQNLTNCLDVLVYLAAWHIAHFTRVCQKWLEQCRRCFIFARRRCHWEKIWQAT